MNDETAQVLLQEFREFRNDITEWRQDTGERVAALEATIKPAIQGNGQPSRLTAVENRVTELEHRRWKHDGMVVALWAIFTAAWEFAKAKFTGHF